MTLRRRKSRRKRRQRYRIAKRSRTVIQLGDAKYDITQTNLSTNRIEV